MNIPTMRIGLGGVDERAERDAKALQRARIDRARANPAWTELDPGELTPSGWHWRLLHKPTGTMYRATPGTLVDERDVRPTTFCVENGEIVVLDQLPARVTA